MSIEKVPNVLLLQIFGFTAVQNMNADKDLFQIRAVCQKFKNILTIEEMKKISRKMYTTPALNILNELFKIATTPKLQSEIIEEALRHLENMVGAREEYIYLISNSQRILYFEQKSIWEKRKDKLESSSKNSSNSENTETDEFKFGT